MATLLGTNISPEKSILKIIFLFPRWDVLISWRVNFNLFGITYLVGKINFKGLFQGPLAKSDLVECVYHMNWWNTKIWAISLLTTIVFLYLRISNLFPALEDDYFRLQNGHFPLQWLLGTAMFCWLLTDSLWRETLCFYWISDDLDTTRKPNWGNDPVWLIFFNWGENANQVWIVFCLSNGLISWWESSLPSEHRMMDDTPTGCWHSWHNIRSTQMPTHQTRMLNSFRRFVPIFREQMKL